MAPRDLKYLVKFQSHFRFMNFQNRRDTVLRSKWNIQENWLGEKKEKKLAGNFGQQHPTVSQLPSGCLKTRNM